MKGQWLNNALAIVLVAWSRKIDASMVSVVVARHNCCRRVAPIANRKDMMTDSLPLPPSLRLLAGSLVFSVSLSAACLAAPPGESPWVKENFEWVTLAMIIIPGLPAVFEVLRHMVYRKRADRAATAAAAAAHGAEKQPRA